MALSAKRSAFFAVLGGFVFAAHSVIPSSYSSIADDICSVRRLETLNFHSGPAARHKSEKKISRAVAGNALTEAHVSPIVDSEEIPFIESSAAVFASSNGFYTTHSRFSFNARAPPAS